MSSNRNATLISKVLAVGAVIAVLSYMFHPEVGQFSLIINGQPVAEPLVRIAAIPTFLVIMGFTALLILLLFFGIGLFFFLGALIISIAFCFVLAPYFWPVLAVLCLIIAIVSVGHDQNKKG